MTFSRGTEAGKREQIRHILGVQEVAKHDKYLGMPATVGRSKKEIFGSLRERVWKRINGWGENFLSSAGREVMVKAVLQAIPSYLMSCFLLPKYITNALESAYRSFWWSGGNGRKMAWLSWHKLCEPKKKGGLGFRDIHCFNLALLAKQGWRLLTNPSSLLFRVYQARYFPTGNFLSARLGFRPSATWRSILRARSFLEKGLRYRVGNGASTSIWSDPWLLDDGSFRPFTARPPLGVGP